MDALHWTRDSKGRWIANGLTQDYRISGIGRDRVLHTIRYGGVAGKPFIRRAHTGTTTSCKARAAYLHNIPIGAS